MPTIKPLYRTSAPSALSRQSFAEPPSKTSSPTQARTQRTLPPGLQGVPGSPTRRPTNLPNGASGESSKSGGLTRQITLAQAFAQQTQNLALAPQAASGSAAAALLTPSPVAQTPLDPTASRGLSNSLQPDLSDDLRALCEQRIASTENYINKQATGGGIQQEHANQLRYQINEIRAREIARPSTEESFENLEKKLRGIVATTLPKVNGKSRVQITAEAKGVYRAAVNAALNQADWNTISVQLKRKNTTYTSTLMPAAQLKLGLNSIFLSDYKGKGVASGSTKETQHAANLYISEFGSGSGKSLFKGVRHGICSPYGLAEGSDERTEGALNRTKEVVTAAVFARLGPEGLKQVLRDGNPIKLNLTSTSLVTPVNFRHTTEGSQLNDQINAWKELSDPNKQPLILPIRDENGDLQHLQINLKVATFNMGVNEAALKLGVASWKPGASVSEPINQEGMKILLGDLFLSNPKQPDLLDGMVGNYLRTVPEPANASAVKSLAYDIGQIFNSNAHRSDGGDPYKLARRLALISHEIGAVPCFNCKSGKDRTGQLDAEIKHELVKKQEQDHYTPAGTILNKGDQDLLGQILLNSGNMEIQKQNTGAAGNKVYVPHKKMGFNLSLAERVSRSVFEKVRGLSPLVKS